MQPTAKFNIYSSSAGSGKTHTLTKEYLKLALRSDQDYYFKRILAITFTNDAANEMKDRILEALKEFASPEFNKNDRFWGMAQQILDEEPLLNEFTLQLRAEAVFYRILQEYSDFSVRTIDSFVNQLVSAFSEDLGLPFNYEIVLDKEVVLLEAVEKLIEKAGTDDHDDISKVLQEFILSKAEDGKSWNNLPNELAEFGSNQLNDLHYSAISKLKDLEVKDYRKIQSQLIAFQENVEKQMAALAGKATQLIENQGLTIEDFSQKGKGIGAYFYNIVEKFEEKFLDDKTPNSYHWKAINDDVWYAKKGTPMPIQASIDGIAEDLRTIFLEIQSFRDENLPKFLLYKNILPHFYKLSLLSKIKAEFDGVLQEKNQVYISEFNRKILEVVLSEPVPFIYERIGEKFNHLLIDEFQDTSEMQFFNLLPLIENSLAKNHFNLIVGDAKQSIYRWRGGKMELIVHLFNKDFKSLIMNDLVSDFQLEQYGSIAPYINPVSLNTNYRSTQEIIEFNNDFFHQILELEATTYPFLPKVYDETFYQKFPKNAHSGGHVEINFIQKDEANEAMLRRIQTLVEKAIADGYEARDIAILTRKNDSSSEVANFLKNLGYDIISRDSLLLKNSGAVRLIISFLRVLNQPDNKLAKYESAYLFYQEILHQIPDNQANNEITEVIENHDIVAFYSYFNSKGFHFEPFALQRVSMYEMCEKIIGILGLFERTNEQEYLFRFLDLVLEFGQRQSNHLQDFLRHWEDKKNKISVKSSGDIDAITITTIHRSKGLEYPIVIIPFANWDMQPIWSNVFWGDLQMADYQELRNKNSENGDLKLHSSPFNFKGELSKTIVADQYLAEMQSQFLENLNMLYVGFTRPIEKLYILSSKSFDKRSMKYGYKGVAELMKKYLEIKGVFNENEEQFIVSSPVGNDNKITRKKIEMPAESIVLQKIISEDRSDKLRLRRISEKIFNIESRDKSKDKGNKVHAVFEKIKSRNDVNDAIEQLEREGLINSLEKVEIAESIKKVIDLPEISALFEPNLRVFTEKEILLPNGTMQRPDRVVLKDSTVYIIDYKTGSPKESHRVQVRDYGNLYRKMGYESVKMLIIYLENLEVVFV